MPVLDYIYLRIFQAIKWSVSMLQVKFVNGFLFSLHTNNFLRACQENVG